MLVIDHVAELRTVIADWRRAGDTLALVPTMGNLHAGHLQLVTESSGHARRRVVSIFVNPLQFGPGEDYQAYPRTRDDDIRLLREYGADLLFAPAVEAIYPQQASPHTRVEVPGLSELWCGRSRPGHFVGVATVVCKLFNLVQPDVAIFGEKDFQQLLLIRRMVEDLAMPVRIFGVPTVREADGLAMSSRNQYLSAEERARAPRLHATLQWMSRGFAEGHTIESLEQQGLEQLMSAGFKPDYLKILRSADLLEPPQDDQEGVVIAAAFLGRTRLIDNLRLTSRLSAS